MRVSIFCSSLLTISQMSWIYFWTYKAKAFEDFRKFNAFVEKQSSNCIKTFCTDGVGEFLTKEFIFFYEENGFRRELTILYTCLKCKVSSVVWVIKTRSHH